MSELPSFIKGSVHEPLVLIILLRLGSKVVDAAPLSLAGLCCQLLITNISLSSAVRG